MRTTITINDTLFRSLKMRAAESDTNMSQLIESALTYQLLEDVEDIEDATAREQESTHSFDTLVARLESEGLL